MWELVTRRLQGHHYVCEFLREYGTDTAHINGAWIAILTLMRDGETVYRYRFGTIDGDLNELDSQVYQEIIRTYNQL